MTDLDAHIRAAIDDIVTATPTPPLDLPISIRPADDHVDGRRSWAGRAVALSAAAAVIVGLVIVVTRPTEPLDAPTSAAPPVLFLPGSVPDGFVVDHVLEYPPLTIGPIDQWFILGERYPGGSFGPTISITAAAPEAIIGTDVEDGIERRPVLLGSGVEGEFSWSAGQELLTLLYLSSPERAVSIQAKATNANDPVAQVMLAIAGAISMVGTEVQVLGPLPANYEVLADTADLFATGPSRVARFSATADPGRMFTVTAQTHEGGFPITAFGGDGHEPIQVRGHEGYVSRHDTPNCDDCATIVVTWLERSDLAITVAADGLTLDEVLAVAEGLEPATEAEWRALAVSASGDDEPVATTLVTTAPADTWADGASLRVYIENGAPSSSVDAVVDALRARPDIVDVDRIAYLGEEASLRAAQVELASDPDTLALLDLDNIPSRIDVWATGSASAADLDALVDQLTRLGDIISVARPDP